MFAKIKDKFKGVNSKKVIRLSAIIFTLAVIIFMTIAQVGFTERFDFFSWLSNVTILMGIGVAFLFFGESSGYDKQRERIVYDEQGNIIGGIFQKTLSKLNELLNKIDGIKVYFVQWYNWYKPQELENKKIDFLTTFGLDPRKASYIVKCCTLSDLSTLKEKTAEYSEIYDENKKHIIRKLEDFEILPVTEVLKGNIRLDACSPKWFLTAFDEPNNIRLLENGNYLKGQIKDNKRIGRAIKLLFTFVISVVWGFFTVKEFMSGDNLVAWMNLISRLLMAISSDLFGNLTSVITVKLEAEILQNKINVLTLFESAYVRNLFPRYSEEELDKQELEKAKKEEEEAKANVVVPETLQIEDKTNLLEGGK